MPVGAYDDERVTSLDFNHFISIVYYTSMKYDELFLE